MLLRPAAHAVAVLVAAAASAAFAAPANAAAPEIDMLVLNSSVAAGASHLLEPFLFAGEEASLTGASITYQLSDSLAGVSFTEPAIGLGCTPQGQPTITCTVPGAADIGPAGLDNDVTVSLTAAASAALDETGTVTVTFAADGITPVKQTAKVTVADGVDLAAGASKTINVTPGATFDATPSVLNNTAKVADGAALLFDTDYPFKAVGQYSNCFYLDDQPTVCTFDQELQLSTAYQVTVPYQLRPDTYTPSSPSGTFVWMTLGDLQDLLDFLSSHGLGGPGTPGKGDPLTLTRLPAIKSLAKQTDLDLRNNAQTLDVHATGKQGTDLAAIGATVTGAVGDTVTAAVGVHNNGPATLDRSQNGGPAAVVIVTIPTGTTVATVPDGCHRATDGSEQTKPGAVQYACYSDTVIPAGATVTFTFALKITKVVANASGAVEVNPACACDRFAADTNKANDVAAIVVNPTGSGSGTGGSGGSSGDGLPITGPQTALLGAAGAALVAAGAAGFFVARRRRTRFEA